MMCDSQPPISIPKVDNMEIEHTFKKLLKTVLQKATIIYKHWHIYIYQSFNTGKFEFI